MQPASLPSLYPWDPPHDRLVLETPEQTRLELSIAPFGSRLVAAAIDTAAVFVISLAVLAGGVLLAAAAGFSADSVDNALMVLGVVYACWSFLGLFYFVWGEVRGEGQTFGKRVVGLRTILATGQGITVGAAIVRNLARIVDNIPLLWLVPTLAPGRRRVGDLLAGTYVVLAQPPAPPRRRIDWPAPSYGELSEREFYFGGSVASRLSPRDLNLVEYLLERVRAAPPARRKRLLALVARRYLERFGWEGEERERALHSPLRFFLELGLFLRSRYEEQAY
ncbi:MAG: RDD family protein [Planctomycetota bacterium]|nr:MAG: RDD family protein [Planctomycetota bacterium]